MVFRGHDGLDELTTTGPSSVVSTGDDSMSSFDLDASELGFPRADPTDLAGGDVEHNVAIAKSVLSGDTGPRRDVVLLNAAAALVVAGRVEGLAGGVETAARSIDSGAAQGVLDRWVEVSRGSAPDG